MLIQDYLHQRRSLVEMALNTYLPKSTTYPTSLSQAIRHAVLAGGKRIRPILALAAADAINGYNTSTQAVACAIEFLHTYTLVHDDLPCMDNDTLRRGEPTVWAKYGEGLAVLVGDALQAMAFKCLADTQDHTSDLLATLSHAAGPQGVIGGQVVDINATSIDANQWDKALIDYIFHHKTADLFIAAMKMGAITAHATASQLVSIERYAFNLGVAFQIIDDLLDVDQSKGNVELTCLAIMPLDEARSWAQSVTQAAKDALVDLPGDTKPLHELADSLLQRVL